MTKSPKIYDNGIYKENLKQRDDIITFLAENRVYPILKKGKITFLKRKKIPFFELYEKDIIDNLGLKSSDDCNILRKDIQKRLEEIKTNKPIKKWIKEERPRELLIKNGAEKLNNAKLLAILLRTGNEGESAEELGRKLLNKFGGLREIDSAGIKDLCSIYGIGEAKATQIKAAFELGKRMMREVAEKRTKIRGVSDVIDYVAGYYSPYLRDAKKEFFNVILLDSGNKPIKNIEIGRGGLEASVVDIREILRESSNEGAASIILVHNHPSGETEPSGEDINTTKRIKEACNLIGVRVLDHIIIGNEITDYVSLMERGLV